MIDFYLFRNTVREALRPQRLAVAAALVALPALIALVWKVFTPPENWEADDVYGQMSSALVVGLILTILAVIYGTGVVSQELEQRTIVYLLTRPVPRWRILLAKFVGSWLVVTATVCLSAALLGLVVYGPLKMFSPQVLTDLSLLPVGAAAYASLFLLVATFLPRPLTFGLLFAFGWETWVPRLPGGFSRASVLAYLHALAPHLKKVAEDARADTEGGASILAPAADPSVIPVWQAWGTLGLLILACLLGAMLIFSQKAYAPREDAA